VNGDGKLNFDLKLFRCVGAKDPEAVVLTATLYEKASFCCFSSIKSSLLLVLFTCLRAPK